jgi:hypothetical protein
LLENLFIQDKKLERTIATLIDNYDDFLKLIKKCINKDHIGKQLTLAAILGKSRRLLKEKEVRNFEERLQKEAQTKDVDFLEVHLLKDKYSYTVQKMPKETFDF